VYILSIYYSVIDKAHTPLYANKWPQSELTFWWKHTDSIWRTHTLYVRKYLQCNITNISALLQLSMKTTPMFWHFNIIFFVRSRWHGHVLIKYAHD